MAKTVRAEFETRRDAEMSIEQLVQELGIERTDVFVSAVESENTVGTRQAGSDTEHGEPDPAKHPKLEGLIEVSVELDDDRCAAAEAVFRDHNARLLEVD